MKANTPTREAIVLVSHDNGTTFVPALDVDPIHLPVTDGLADVFDPSLVGLMDALVTWESLDMNTEYRLVWSDTRSPVKGTCSMCDDFFIVSEGMPGENDVICGCEDND